MSARPWPWPEREGDPCLPLAVALRHLQYTYGPPRTRAQIAAWNEAERAMDDLRARLAGKDGGHKTPNPDC